MAQFKKEKLSGISISVPGYKIETIEDYLTDIEIEYMTGLVKRKGGEKMSRPYLGCKVVEVKKRKCKHSRLFLTRDLPYRVYKCIKCGEVLYPPQVKNRVKSKGNWVNGENLDKIKFPVPCSYYYEGVKHYGLLKNVADGRYGGIFKIFDLKQDRNHDCCEFSLKPLIINWKVKILKGKIILFEEGD